MTVFGSDAVQVAVEAALRAVEAGRPAPERRQYDFKEEAGRRGRRGEILPGAETSETAAVKLAPEVACMANSPGGGALVLGIGDDGTVIGTQLDVDWLQRRLYELLDQRVTTVIIPHAVRGTRVLVIRVPPAVEPVAYKQRVTWRVGDQCVEIDAASWRENRLQGSGYDWSAQPSDLPVVAVRSAALVAARQLLRDAGDDRSLELAAEPDLDLLRRLGVVLPDSTLTNGGAVLLVGRRTPALDYIRRPYAGADSESRVNLAGRSLLEELTEVFRTARAYNPEVHVGEGLAVGRQRLLPERALREAIVNGVAHREWIDPAATLVEHVGATVRVTSPGGFFGGVKPDNIINHPSRSRNTALAAALAILRVAERQGVGVDRMYGDMLRLGHPQPVIEEHDGARVLVVLVGDRPDVSWMQWLRTIDGEVELDLRVLMALHRLVNRWWTDAADLAPYLQVTREEAAQVAARIRDLRLGGAPVAIDIEGVPAAASDARIAISGDALARLDALSGSTRTRPAREVVAHTYARHTGRISTTELASIVGAHPSNVGGVLRALENEGILEPSRQNRRGAGFFYRFTYADESAR